MQRVRGRFSWGYGNDLIAVDEPQIAADTVVAHLAYEVHVLAYLFVVLLAFASELEVDDYPLRAVGHDAVGTSLDHLSVGLSRQDGALVEELL